MVEVVYEALLDENGVANPELVRNDDHPDGRHYVIEDFDDEVSVPSVSTVLDAYHKPALDNWKLDQVLDVWANDPGWLAANSFVKAKSIPEEASRPSWEHGNAVHEALADHLMEVGTYKNQDFLLEESVWRDTNLALQLLRGARFIPAAAEVMAWHTGPYAYAGTIDLLGVLAPDSPLLVQLGLPYELHTVLVDLKTGKGIWETAAMQVAAYSYCHYWADRKGVVRDLDVDLCLILHVHGGKAQFHTINRTHAWKVFEWVRRVWEEAVNGKQKDFHQRATFMMADAEGKEPHDVEIL